MKKFQFIFICILAFMLNFQVCFNINIKPVSITIEYKGKLFI